MTQSLYDKDRPIYSLFRAIFILILNMLISFTCIIISFVTGVFLTKKKVTKRKIHRIKFFIKCKMYLLKHHPKFCKYTDMYGCFKLIEKKLVK
jgi:hypothetical protein